MPPRKHIVKSGNAGNSSKSAKAPIASDALPKPAEGPPPLFPPGVKTPLSLLYERCQKNGWEKPLVEPRHNRGGTWACIVTLRRPNKKTSSIDSVNLIPHPPLEMSTATEAKHWGATYALHRFANDRSYHLFLPNGPKEYWKELQQQREAAPTHQAWMWQSDPFSAQKEVDERQAKAAKKKEDIEKTEAGIASGERPVERGRLGREWERAPEVRMAQELRGVVESAIKVMSDKLPSLFPSHPESASSSATPVHSVLSEHLLTMGFPPALIPAALANPCPTLSSALTYLLLHTPEPLLPPAFRASASSAPFVVSAHSGKAELARRWAGDRLVELGWPRVAVEVLDKGIDDVIWDGSVSQGLEILSERLCEMPVDLTLGGEPDLAAREDEITVLQSMHPNLARDEEGYSLPIASSPLILRILLPTVHPYPSPSNPRLPPFYISSSNTSKRKITVWDRLELTKRLVSTALSEWHELLLDGQCIVSLMTDWLELNWEDSLKNVQPGALLETLLPRPTAPAAAPKLTIPEEPRRERRPTRSARVRKLDDDKERQVYAQIRQEAAYIQMENERRRLPAFGMKDQIVQTIKDNKVTVVIGETGCGKTTQLPQFILDDLLLSNTRSTRPVSILITQPRRLSAMGVAARVSSERIETKLGQGTVGYAIRGESRTGDRTRLLFVTTGVALRMLSSEEGLSGFTHVIVDEVHERSVDSDFLLLELKESLHRNVDIKVVLMSATINQEVFVRYFDNAPVVKIPGFTYPVTDHYLEGIMPHIKYRPPFVKPKQKQTDEQQNAFRRQYFDMGLAADEVQAVENISRSDRIDYQLVASVVGHIVATTPDDGAVLIFMPGVAEIKQCMNSLRSLNAITLLPLHANLSPAEQKLVFQGVPKGHRKIVVATNVAETSITIPDVVHVVDAGRVKENRFDPETGMSRLIESWVPKAGAKQRRGRAGRTREGACWKIYTRKMEADYMPNFAVPEMLRVPLESLCLQVKVERAEEDPKMFLSKAISPPNLVALDQAWSVLGELGAVDETGSVTSLGRYLALLPMDLRLAKMLILAAVFRCLDPILTVVACLSSKPLFNSPLEKREEAKRARSQFMTGNSDLLTDAKGYEKCRELRKGASALRTFCEDSFISFTTVRDITSLRQDFYGTLADIGFVPFSSDPTDAFLNVNSTNENLLKAVITGGLWPRVARVALPKASFQQVQAGTVQKDHEAREVKFFDRTDSRVFLHPGSVLFSAATFKSPFIAYFSRYETSKVFLRDATEVPLYGILLFGGTVVNDPLKGGLSVDGWIKMRAWSRIGVLVNQLRRCLDAHLAKSIDEASLTDLGSNPVLDAMLALLERDGLAKDGI